MYRITRQDLKQDIKDTLVLGNIVYAIELCKLLGISKNKILTMADVNQSNFNKWVNTGVGLSDNKKERIKAVIQEVLF